MRSAAEGLGNRKSPRRAFNRPVGVLIKGVYHIVEAMEIGEGGISLKGPLDLQINDQLVVAVLLPGGLGHAVARAQVRSSQQASGAKPQSFGLQFLNMPLMSRRAIRNYVAAKTEEEASSSNVG